MGQSDELYANTYLESDRVSTSRKTTRQPPVEEDRTDSEILPAPDSGACSLDVISKIMTHSVKRDTFSSPLSSLQSTPERDLSPPMFGDTIIVATPCGLYPHDHLRGSIRVSHVVFPRLHAIFFAGCLNPYALLLCCGIKLHDQSLGSDLSYIEYFVPKHSTAI